VTFNQQQDKKKIDGICSIKQKTKKQCNQANKDMAIEQHLHPSHQHQIDNKERTIGKATSQQRHNKQHNQSPMHNEQQRAAENQSIESMILNNLINYLNN
jgi:hypothetical protein